jgi:vacuolar-type H+-ATPase subunit H
MEFSQLIDELENMGEQGERRWYCRFPLFGKTVIEADDFFELVSQIRSSLPAEMTLATQVAQEREQIIEDAARERQKILDSAREQAQLLVSTDSLVAEAQKHAVEIRQKAEVEADAIRAEAEQWARGIVERLENYLGRISATVEKTKKAMNASAPMTRGPGS